MNQGNPPPNWYPDPRGEAELRYWDGSQWTEHTHSGAAAAAQPAAPPPSTAPPPQAPPPAGPPPQAGGYGAPVGASGGGGGGRTALIVGGAVLALLLVAGALVLLLGGGDDGGGDEEKVEEVVQKAITGREPEGCRELVTENFLKKSTHQTGSAAIDECESDRADSELSEDVDVSDVEVDGTRATANAKLNDGPLDGETLEMVLVKTGEDWKVDDLDRPAQAEKDTAEKSIISTVLNFGSSEGDKACEYLSYKKLEELGGESGCSSAFKDAVAANYLPQDSNITGRTATLTVRETKQNDIIEFSLSRELGDWKIDDYEKQT